MITFANTKMTLELFGQVSIYFGLGVQIVASIILGGIVGYDREVKLKAAGLKTNIMICVGATIYTSMSLLNLESHHQSGMIDPNRLAAQIVSGIGFLGAGAIIQGQGSVTGLTTAATIWVVAAIGYTVGVGYPFTALLFSITVLLILRAVSPINKMLEEKGDSKDFHIEVLSFGSVTGTLRDIISQEQIDKLLIREEPHPVYQGQYHIDIYLTGNHKSIERLTTLIGDTIRVKKVHYHPIAKFPQKATDSHLEKNNNS